MTPVALITDFGESDWYVGEMKGAMLCVYPQLTIIDITHHIPPGDISSAAFTLATCFRTFPDGTVFCVVVDPGVGSDRRAIAVDCGSYRLVGPDNGVLSWALEVAPAVSVRIIGNSDYFHKKEISRTFHGRDIFGPVSAHLAKGVRFATVGDEAMDYVKIPFPRPSVTDTSIIAEILAVDRFGNAVTSIEAGMLRHLRKNARFKLRIGGNEIDIASGDFFQSVPHGMPLCYIGSAGYLEIGVNGGSAAAGMGLTKGDSIELLIQ